MTDKILLILNGPGVGDSIPAEGTDENSLTLAAIELECSTLCQRLGLVVEFHRAENDADMHSLIDRNRDRIDALVVNPIGNSQSSRISSNTYRETIQMICQMGKPVIEVHVSNIFRQEHESATARPILGPASDIGFISGLGACGYLLAINAIAGKLRH